MTPTSVVLSTTCKSPITHILHASDIHIRTGDLDKCRYTEYRTVFKEFVQKVQTLPYKDSSVMVLTGDIFHHKGKIEPAGIKLAQEFLDDLLDLMDVFLICGNHDYRQDNPAIPDMIETIYKNYLSQKTKTPHRAFYLSKTGYYQYQNLGFTVVDIRDTLKDYNTAGRKDTLEAFPSVEAWGKEIIPVALFHGTILSSRMANNLQLEEGYDREWFGKYPFLLLGDNHRTQCFREGDCMWGYSGSLIQQDFGESLVEHGFLVWDLVGKKVEHHEVPNPFSFCSMKVQKGTGKLYLHRKQREWVLADSVPFPKYPMIRVFDPADVAAVEAFCKDQGAVPRAIQCWNTKEAEGADGEGEGKNEELWLSHLEELNTPENWCEYISKLGEEEYRDMILNPELLKLPLIEGGKRLDFIKKYGERNEKIQKALDEYLNESGKTQRTIPRVELLQMSWSYLMCYGPNNSFDFQGLDGKIVLLNGKNAMGKSSFLDVLCIGLFGEPTRMRNLVNGKKYTDKIIHDQRPVGKVAPFVRILFRVGEETYEIYRSFGSQAAKNKEHLILQTSIQIFRIQGTYKEILCEGSTLVDKWMEEHVGDMDTILMSTMVCQVDLNNFFHLKQEEQKTILDKALRLENVSLFGKVLKESSLAHQDILQQIQTACRTIENLHGTVTEGTVAEVQGLRAHVEEIERKLEGLEKQKELFRELGAGPAGGGASKTAKQGDYEAMYREAEVKYHSLPVAIQEEHKETYYRYKEKLAGLRKAYEKLQDCEEGGEGIQEKVLLWKKKYERFLTKKPVCDVSAEWMEQTKQEYEAWKGKKEPEVGVEESKKAFEKAKQRVFSLGTVEKPRGSQVEAEPIGKQEYWDLVERRGPGCYSIKKHNAWVESYQGWLRDFEDCVELGPDSVREKHKELTEKQETYKEKDEELREVQGNLLGLEKELSGLAQLEFNPDCWACQKNPYCLKKTEVQASQKELLKYCKELQKYIGKLQKTQLPEKWKEKTGHYEAYLAQYQTMEHEREQWEIDRKLAAYEWARYERKKAEKQNAERDYNLWEGRCTEAIEYDKEKRYWDGVAEKLETHQEAYEAYKVWCEEHEIIQEKLRRLERTLEKKQIGEALRECQKVYDDLHYGVETYIEYMEWKGIYYNEKRKAVEREYKEYWKDKQELLGKISSWEAEEAYREKQQETRQFLLGLEEQFMARLKKIKGLDTLFMGDKTTSDGYKEWIYKNQVIPLLNREMNRFLHMFEEFSFTMVYEKKNFIYLLEDRGNQPTLDKASGYQNFIIGLALRIVLARIGAVGQQMKHLFMDEGFTACDSNNIEKIPVLLENMLKYGEYHSILLMSHLDSVRECSQVTVDIQRKDPFSMITFGKEYPEYGIYDSHTGVVTVKKGRGRPGKKALA